MFAAMNAESPAIAQLLVDAKANVNAENKVRGEWDWMAEGVCLLWCLGGLCTHIPHRHLCTLVEVGCVCVCN